MNMNNDAKDAIGALRAINILVLLTRMRQFVFPLDLALVLCHFSKEG
jgi:hypothetical protein